MGRPKLHLTPEERVIAARSYRQQYYIKHRTTINQKLSHKRKEKKVSSTECMFKQPPPGLMGKPTSKHTLLLRCPGRPKCRDNSTIARRMDSTQDSELGIKSDLKNIIGSSSRACIAALYEGFIASGKSTEIHNTLSSLEELQKRIRALDSINWAPASSTVAVTETTLALAVRNVVRVLEDLLLNIMESTDIKDLARWELLLFQAAPDVTLGP